MDLSPLLDFCRQEQIPLTEEQKDRFNTFGEALYEFNTKMNLTRVPYDQCALRHFVDSLIIARLIPTGSSVLDIGCGAGFPSWPLACARPDLEVTGLDGSAKPLQFVKEHPLINLKVVQARAEEQDPHEAYDVVTGRALAPFPLQAETSIPLVKVGGVFLPLRTSHDWQVVEKFPFEQMGAVLEGCERVLVPGLDGERLIPVVRKLKKTPRQYPRRWAEMKKRPLSPDFLTKTRLK